MSIAGVQNQTATDRIFDSVCLIPGQTARQLADYLELPYNTTRAQLTKLKNRGDVYNDEVGKWYQRQVPVFHGFSELLALPEFQMPKLRLPWWRRLGWMWGVTAIASLAGIVGYTAGYYL